MEERIIKDINNLLTQLFQKMHDAGYEWDAEKKELRKISQRMISAEAKEAMYDKPAWSEEDKSKVQRICKYLDEAKKYYADIIEVRECMDWLKSLRDRYTWKPSEEQMADLWNMVCECRPSDQQLLQDLYYGLKTLRGE